MEAAGWYHAEGDPDGTVRYWNGESWVGGPVAQGQSSAGGGGWSDDAVVSPGIRIAGRIIDWLIQVALSWAFIFLFARDAIAASFNGAWTGNNADYPVVAMIIAAIFPFVWTVLWIIFAGGTPGKLILGMRVADAKAPVWQRATNQEAVIRSSNYLLSILSIFSLSLQRIGALVSLSIALASLIMLFTDDLHRTVMDRVGSTLIIKKEYLGEQRAGAPVGDQ